jgi:hypothetical protein
MNALGDSCRRWLHVDRAVYRLSRKGGSGQHGSGEGGKDVSHGFNPNSSQFGL